jgi:DNA-binding winged helix-turn-helix (wHTH) protein
VLYLIGPYILDSHKRVLLNEEGRSLVSDNERIIELLFILAREYPRVVSRAELLDNIWPTKEGTNWALSRLIADTRLPLGEDSDREKPNNLPYKRDAVEF